jgi:diguanylate cyclase (GGDEF)-like protein/PAS domain S-box-containing protein
MKILFAEDSIAIAKPIIKALEDERHRVVLVQDGEAAVASYVNEPFDLVLMDVIMPKMDGLDAIRQIKKVPNKKWIPIVVLTGLDSKTDLIKALDAGADDYLLKPIDFDVLIARMRSKQRIVEMQSSFFGVLDNVHEGILTITALGKIQRFNLAAEKIFGYSYDEVFGNNVNMLMPEPYHSGHDGYLRNYLATREPKVIGIGRTVQGRRKNGDVFPMHLAVTEVETARGLQFIGLVRDISKEEEARQRIEFMALHDALTGLPNRASFNNFLAAMVLGKKPFTVMFIDIDGFKPVNDTFGHDVGDMVLINIAQRLTEALPENAFISRLGGDEFVVILSDVGEPNVAEKYGLSILDALRLPMICSGNDCKVGASIGVALFPNSGSSQESIMNAADNAMYRAKRSGKNRVVFAE